MSDFVWVVYAIQKNNPDDKLEWWCVEFGRDAIRKRAAEARACGYATRIVKFVRAQ